MKKIIENTLKEYMTPSQVKRIMTKIEKEVVNSAKHKLSLSWYNLFSLQPYHFHKSKQKIPNSNKIYVVDKYKYKFSIGNKLHRALNES